RTADLHVRLDSERRWATRVGDAGRYSFPGCTRPSMRSQNLVCVRAEVGLHWCAHLDFRRDCDHWAGDCWSNAVAAELSPAVPSVLQAVRARRSGRRYWLIALFLGLSIVTLPPALAVPGAGLDPSWILGMNMALWQHLKWGSQVVWTYCPYGFLASLYYYQFNTWIAAFMVTLVVHVGLFLAIATFLLHIGARSWQAVLVGMVFLLPLT